MCYHNYGRLQTKGEKVMAIIMPRLWLGGNREMIDCHPPQQHEQKLTSNIYSKVFYGWVQTRVPSDMLLKLCRAIQKMDAVGEHGVFGGQPLLQPLNNAGVDCVKYAAFHEGFESNWPRISCVT